MSLKAHVILGLFGPLLLLMGLWVGQAHAQDLLGLGIGEESSAEETKPKDNISAIELFPEALHWPKLDKSETGVWQTFFDRRERGFDMDTIRRLPGDLWEILSPLVDELMADPWKAGTQTLAPVFTVLGLIILFYIVQRRLKTYSKPLEEKLLPLLPDWLDTLGRSSVRLGLFVLPAIVLQILVHIGVAFFQAETTAPAIILREAMWFFVGYRVAYGLLLELLGGHWIDVNPDNIRRLRLLILWVMRVAFIFQVALMVVRQYAIRTDVEALVWFLFKILLAVVCGSLVWLKSEIFELLPEAESHELLWSTVRNRIDRQYNAVLGISIGLLALWLVGYANAASFLLSRGYAVLVLLALLSSFQVRLTAWMSPRIATAPTEEQREGLVRMGRGLRFAMGILFLGAVLWLIGLWPYIEILLKFQLLRIGKAILSLYGLATALAIFAVFLLISRLARPVLMERFYPRVGLDVAMGYAINTVAHYLLVTVGFLAALASLGVDLGALTLFATAFSVGIGFGLQDITRNLVSGFILLFGRSVKKGDFVKVDEHFGRVEALGARSVQIVTPDNMELVIPSSRLVDETIVNYTYSNPRIRMHIPVGVHYGADVRVVEQALLNAALRHGAVLRTPNPSVRLMEFGDNSVNFELLIWIDVRRIDPPKVRGELYFHIWDVLKEQDIEIPFPQRDIHLRAGDVVEQVVRALRGDDRLPTPEPPPSPSLRRFETYLTKHDERPNILDTEPHLDSNEMLNSFMIQRQQTLHGAINTFFETQTDALDQFSKTIGVFLDAPDNKNLDTSFLDHALDAPVDRWSALPSEWE